VEGVGRYPCRIKITPGLLVIVTQVWEVSSCVPFTAAYLTSIAKKFRPPRDFVGYTHRRQWPMFNSKGIRK
jgi:hypothetical protein